MRLLRVQCTLVRQTCVGPHFLAVAPCPVLLCARRVSARLVASCCVVVCPCADLICGCSASGAARCARCVSARTSSRLLRVRYFIVPDVCRPAWLQRSDMEMRYCVCSVSCTSHVRDVCRPAFLRPLLLKCSVLSSSPQDSAVGLFRWWHCGCVCTAVLDSSVVPSHVVCRRVRIVLVVNSFRAE